MMRTYRLAVIWILRIVGLLLLASAIYSVAQYQLDTPGVASIDDFINNIGTPVVGPLILVGVAEVLALGIRSERSQEARS